MAFLLAKDALNGKSGKAFMTKDGQNIELFGLKKVEVTGEVETSDFAVVGTLVNQTKPKGIKYSGTLTVYYGTPAFVEVLEEYRKTGAFPEISLQITNEDKGSSVGKQIIAVYGVMFTKITLALLDDSTDFLQQELPFTFTHFEALERFKAQPKALGGN